MKLEGILRHADLGGGAWVLETSDGERIALYGDVPKTLAGKAVQVHGKLIDGMGFAMVGERAVEVSSVTPR
jgi:hypothetical protein